MRGFLRDTRRFLPLPVTAVLRLRAAVFRLGRPPPRVFRRFLTPPPFIGRLLLLDTLFAIFSASSAVTEEIMSIFHDLNREGITIVMVTHEMDIAAQAKRTIRLLDGRIVSDERKDQQIV